MGRLHSDLKRLWEKSLEEAKISGSAVLKPLGVNVLGWTHGLFGVAESARLVYLSVQSTNVPVVANTLLFALEHNHTDRSIADTREAPYRFNLVVCNADSTPMVPFRVRVRGLGLEVGVGLGIGLGEGYG